MEIQIVDISHEMAVKSKNNFSNIKNSDRKTDTKGNNKNQDTHKTGIVTDAADNGDMEKLENGENTRFVDKFENILFNKKSLNNETSHKASNTKENLQWDEEKQEYKNIDKEKNLETIKIPGGKGQSRNIVWKDGYSRRIIFQPEIDYPLYFRKQGIQASVRLLIEVDGAGNVVSAEIKETSGFSRLDILARNGIMGAKFARREYSSKVYDRGEIEVQYRLEQ
ncbi:MAG: energy transducer TonB [Spirochaetia bacterium]|nr:energy transducer TonB [Spirochaetia bacterium]